MKCYIITQVYNEKNKCVCRWVGKHYESLLFLVFLYYKQNDNTVLRLHLLQTGWKKSTNELQFLYLHQEKQSQDLFINTDNAVLFRAEILTFQTFAKPRIDTLAVVPMDLEKQFDILFNSKRLVQ